jgi:RNA polymerase sigma factor (sigma-70 family)
MAVGKFNESIYLQDNPDEEQQLLQRLAAGEINAFWPLWQKYRDYLFRFCLRLRNGNSVEAEDLLSQGMLKAREKVQNFAGKIANFKSWVTALVRNFWLDMQRRPCAKQVEDIEVYAEREEVGLVSAGETPEIALEREDKKMVIRRAIDELPALMRETFILHFYEELSHQEIVERQKVPYQNVCKRISQARAILAKKLRGYFIGEDGAEPDTAKVPAKPAKSKKAVQKAAQVEPILSETVTVSEQLEESGEVSHQAMGEGQEISGQNVGEHICEVPAILEAEDGTIMELAVMPVGREPVLEEMSQGNAGVEPVVGVPVTLSFSVAEVECVGREELPVVAGSEQQSESDSVAATYEGRLEKFNAIGKPVVGAFSRWLSKLEEDEKLSHQEMGNRQEISGQNVGERICEVPAILEAEDGTIMELAVMPVGSEPVLEEMSQGNAGVEPVVRVPVILSVAVAEVECVAGEELPVVAGSVGNSESDSVVGSSGGRLSEFNFIGKPVVGAFSRWLHCFGGSQLFYGIRKLVLEVRGEWCRWVEPVVWGDNGCRWGTLRENLCERPDILLCVVFPYFQYNVRD